jgi:hypothetical protein
MKLEHAPNTFNNQKFQNAKDDLNKWQIWVVAYRPLLLGTTQLKDEVISLRPLP